MRFFTALLILFLSSFLVCFCNPNSSSGSDIVKNVSIVNFFSSRNQTNGSFVSETRPFRGRTVSLNVNHEIEVYDWDRDRFVFPKENGELLTNVIELYPSEYGRYSFVKTNSGFRIIDVGLNVSPHGDHYHYDRFNEYEIIPDTHLNLNSPVGTIPYKAYSKDGWTVFSYSGGPNGQFKILSDKQISETNPVILYSPQLPENVLSSGTIVSKDFLLFPSAGISKPTEFKVMRHSVGWNNLSPEITIPCPDFNAISHTQIPVSNADYSNLESGYDKVHYVIVSCGKILNVIRHEDGNLVNPTSQYQISTEPLEFKYIVPVFQNSNIDRGGKLVRPYFIANSGQSRESGFHFINLDSGTTQHINSVPYYFKHIETEKRAGDFIFILSENGKIHSYRINNFTISSIVDSEIAYSPLLKFSSIWYTGFILKENEIHEFNLEENFKTRVLKTKFNNLQTDFHDFFGPGKDYE
jgi:hypothetical protein